jgi:nicotinate-nucleotide pyrophosphorylase (carboxylating)
MDPPRAACEAAVEIALAEDLPGPDLTSDLLAANTWLRASIVSREAGRLAGRLCAELAFAKLNPEVSCRFHLGDGDAMQPGTVVADLWGPAAPILSAERTALNFLGHLSGIATLTSRYVQAAGPGVRILDTRKTTPGLRVLEKAAVRAGGGFNHRLNLSEAVLIKDNHRLALDLGSAVAQARRQWPGRQCEVECDDLSQVRTAIGAGAEMVLLDNMSVEDLARCVRWIRSQVDGGRVLIECSGGVTLANVADLAATGVDLISVGALTHSAPALDLGLDGVSLEAV